LLGQNVNEEDASYSPPASVDKITIEFYKEKPPMVSELDGDIEMQGLFKRLC
jgi:hypothetical protein